MSKISSNISTIRATLPESVKLIAVSKTKPISDIREAYMGGQRVFGENKIQELSQKYKQLPKDIEWHMIGHVQSNKVKYIASFVSLIHAVDSYKLLQIINKEAIKNNRTINCLLQVHIATEETKFGCSLSEIEEIIDKAKESNLKNVSIKGVMGMASFTTNIEQVKSEFRNLRNNFTYIKNKYFPKDEFFTEISMGMSGDYKLAIEEGSTMVRIGSSIFGQR